jgi:FMN phosphatase YigB (HAD superfamily)
MMYSFDVFDTILTRTTKTPKGIFALMQEQLEREPIQERSPFVVRNFYHIRLQSEAVLREAVTNSEHQDVTLAEIYAYLGKMYRLPDEFVKELMALEMQTEAENCLPVEENIELVKRHIANGERVVLISDMYMSEKQIRFLLHGIDPVFDDVPLYVSSEYRKTKGSGELYRVVQEKEHVEWNQWVHMGDNERSDVQIPQRLGIKAQLYERKVASTWNDVLSGENEQNPSMQMLCGAADRAMRNRECSIAYRVGCGYAAPLLYPYILWVLDQSLKQKITKLYFIARDGFLLKEIADRVIAARELPIQTAYLYGSRRAWRLPSVTGENFVLKDYVKWSNDGFVVSAGQLAELFGFSVEELQDFLPFEITENTFFEGNVRNQIILMLAMREKEIAALIEKKQEARRTRVISYLKQEIPVSEGENYAFVEILGSGYTQGCLASLMRAWNPNPVRTFFYHLDGVYQSDRTENISYFPNRLKYGTILEVLCAADHGQTLDYEKRDGEWVPVFGQDEGQLLDAYGFRDYEKGILDFTDEILKNGINDETMIQNLEVPVLLFRYLEEKRDSKLYNYIADMPYGISGLEKKVTSYIPQISNKEMREIYIFHKGEPMQQYYGGIDWNLSMERLSGRQKHLLEIYKKIGEWKLVDRWRHHQRKKNGIRVLTSNLDVAGRHVILYGAGKRGRRLYGQLQRKEIGNSEVVLWVDSNYGQAQADNLPVVDPEKIRQTDFDSVLITVAKKELADEITAHLLEMGVAEWQIMRI